MTRILYIGNILSAHGKTPTTIETLTPRLKSDFEVRTASSKNNKILRILDMLWAIVANKRWADVVLIDTYSTSAYTYAKACGTLCRALNMKYIAFLHGGELPARFDADKSQSEKYLKGATAIVSPSGYLQDAVKSRFNLKPYVIPNFLDIELYPFVLRSNLRPLRILWVRSFHKIYNPEMAIEILALLQTKGLDANLTMVGPDKDGSLLNCQNRAKELGLEKLVTFTGRLPKPEWIELSAKHNLFLSTTSVDNTPVSVMEAMALGMPVVTTKVGGIPFLFEDGVEGVMVDEQHAEAMTEAILNLLNNAEKVATISQAARNKAAQWDWQVVRKLWVNLLAEQ